MLDPVGPLPASVYWRRRAVALAAVIVVLLLGWAVLPGGGNDQPRDSAAAAGSASPTVPAAAPTELTASPPSDDPGRPADGDGGAATTTTPVPTTPKPSPPPAPKACADAALQVTVGPRHPAYSVGQSPILDLRVRNVSTVACTRDLGAGQQEIVLYRGQQRLWSSNDCFPDPTRSVQLLQPGAVQTSSVTWSGLGSRPKCAGTRVRVGAGTYALVARLGSIVSQRSPIVLR